MENEKNGLSLPVLLSLVAGFFTLSGGLWHLGYWSTFQFNYFEYASLTDLFKSSFYFLVERTWVVLGIIVFASAFSYLQIAFLIKVIDEDNIEKSSEQYKKIEKQKKAIQTFTDVIIIISLLVSGTFIMLGWALKYSLDILPFSISIALVSLAFRHKLLGKITKNYFLNEILTFSLIIYPVFNFFLGKNTGLDIENGNKYSAITFFVSKNPVWNKAILGSPYLGSSSEYHFIYSSFREVLVFRKDQVESFTLDRMNKFTYPEGHKFHSYEEVLQQNNSLPLIIDTTKTYYDPALKIQIDSSFRQAIRETLLKKVK